jgi:adenylate cyclase
MLEIAFHNPRQHRQFQHEAGPLVLSRADADAAVWTAIDRDQSAFPNALVEILPQGDGVALAMAGCEAECFCGRSCSLTGNCRLPVPATFSIGDTRFEIMPVDNRANALKRPLQRLLIDDTDAPPRQTNAAGPSPETLSRWFAALGTLNRWATSLQELYVQATRCAVEAIGLDGAIVLRRRNQEWEIAASHLPHPELGIHCDLSVLNQLLLSPETLFDGASDTKPQPARPLQRPGEEPPAVVVSPLRNSTGHLVGAIYGYRSLRQGNSRSGIRYLEAHWIELLAAAVTGGIVRLEREGEVDRRRVMLERAFVATLDNDPQKMIGETREATLLFADLRDFTRLSASLETNVVYELLAHVMDCLTAAVMDLDGLVIDYYGDGLAAMWNAPADQAEHAELACRAGLRMLETVPDVVADWAGVLGRELQIGIGVNTGVVKVGNPGSSRRMKYGPRGANVNLTSRVESATKAIGLPLIVTRSTAAKLSNRFAAHRVCRARLPGVDEPLDLFGVHLAAGGNQSTAWWPVYDEALRLFERGDVEQAAARLATIDPTASDIPTPFLAEHIQRELGQKRHRRSDDKAATTHGVITFTEK